MKSTASCNRVPDEREMKDANQFKGRLGPRGRNYARSKISRRKRKVVKFKEEVGRGRGCQKERMSRGNVNYPQKGTGDHQWIRLIRAIGRGGLFCGGEDGRLRQMVGKARSINSRGGDWKDELLQW